jgi:hypothetical protein
LQDGTLADDEVHHLTDEESRLVDESLAELDRGEAASEAEVRAVFDKYRK